MLFIIIPFETSRIEEFISKIKQIHFWYFWEKQVSLTEFIHMSMGKQNLDLKQNVCAWVRLSESKFYSVTSSNVILYNGVKTQLSSKGDLSGFGTELFSCISIMIIMLFNTVYYLRNQRLNLGFPFVWLIIMI